MDRVPAIPAASPDLETAAARRSQRTAAWLVSLVVLALAAAIRLLGITQPQVWRDEAVTLMRIRMPWRDVLLRLPAAEDTPPLPFLLFKAWGLASDAEWWMRLLPVVLGVATVGVLMRTAERIRGGSGWAVGVLAAVSYLPVHYSQELRTYALWGLVSAIGLYVAERAAREPSWRRGPYWLAITGAVAAHCHAVGVFVYPMLWVYWLVRGGLKGRSRREVVMAPALWLVLAAPMIVFDLQWARLHAAGYWWVPDVMKRSARKKILEQVFGLAAVDSWGERSRVTHSLWIAFAAQRVLMLAPAVLLIGGLVDKTLRRPIGAIAAAAAAYVVLLVAGSGGAVQATIDRTLVPAWLGVVLALGIGAGTQRSRSARRAMATAVVAIAIVQTAAWTWTVYGPEKRRPQDAELCAWIHARIRPADLVLSEPAWMEDVAAYYLGDVVRGEQFFSTGTPLYRDLPPVPRPIRRERDPQWRSRIAKAIREHRARVGDDFAIWIVRQSFPVDPADPNSLESLLVGDFVDDEEILLETAWIRSATRCVPAPTATGPAP